MGGNLTLPCEKSGSYLRASRLTPSTVRVKARTNRALARQISTPLSNCVPPCSSSVPNSSRFSSASNVSWTDAAYDDLLEPFPSTLLSSVLGGIEFGRKPLFESDFSLTATALNPGMLEHGKVVDFNHLHVAPSPCRPRPCSCECVASDSETTWFSFGWRTGFMFSMFDGQGEPDVDCPSHNGMPY